MSDSTNYPLQVFRFQVDFTKSDASQTSQNLCRGEFSDCTGLEATMEPKVIKEGGRNYGAIQRAGPVTFATVILKRGITTSHDLWQWFELVNGQAAYAYRLNATITLLNDKNQAQLKWQLERALPIKFKAADFNAKATEVGVEELHLAHEGLRLIS
jgi:phage tail-like protein